MKSKSIISGLENSMSTNKEKELCIRPGCGGMYVLDYVIAECEAPLPILVCKNCGDAIDEVILQNRKIIKPLDGHKGGNFKGKYH